MYTAYQEPTRVSEDQQRVLPDLNPNADRFGVVYHWPATMAHLRKPEVRHLDVLFETAEAAELAATILNALD